MDAPKRQPGRSFCPNCGQKYAIPEAELKTHPGQKFHATCRSCGTPFAVYWGDEGLVTEEDRIQHDRGEDGRNVLAKGARVGKYEIEAMIASGGSSTIYRAFEMGANRTVALKVLHQAPDSEYGVRFRREVEAQGNLKHPNLMPIFDQGKVDQKPYYTMELLHKPVAFDTIIALFRDNRLGYNPSLRSLNSLEALLRQVMLPVARAVAFANQNGVIHRDIKPGNIVVDGRTLHTYLIDFGICHLFKKAGSRLVLRGGEQPKDTEDNERMATMGTVRFMPPEQARGDVSPQGDVWALGALLQNLISGDAPIAPAINLEKVGLEKRLRNLKKIAASCRKAGDHDEAAFYDKRVADLEAGTHRTMKDVLRDAQNGNYVPLPAGTDPSLAAIVSRAMAPDPKDRYQNAELFAMDVKRWLDGQPVRAYMGRVGGGKAGLYQARLFFRRNRNPIIVAAVVVLLGAILFVTQILSSSSDEEARIENWMREARDTTDALEQEDRLTKILALRPGHTEAQEMLTLSRKFGPIKRQIEAATAARRRVIALRSQRKTEAAGELAEDTAAVLETVVLPALRDLPPDYPGRKFEKQAMDLAMFLRGERVVRLGGVPNGVTVSLVASVSRNNPTLRWTRGKSWGTAPLSNIGHALRIGSYVLVFERPGKSGVHLPFTVSRATPSGGIEVVCPRDPGDVPDGMVFVTGIGEMVYGDLRFQEEVTTVLVDPFFLDVWEVSNADYKRYLDSLDEGFRLRAVPRRLLSGPGERTTPTWTITVDGYWEFPDGTGSFPVTGVSFLDASAYADWAGKRLPTPQEWELAARGIDGRDYPFGARLDPKACNAHTRDLKPRGKFVRDVSPYGVRDMAGNVAEWTGRGGGTLETVKGGSFELPRYRAMATSFGRRRADLPYTDVGFRCAQDVE